MKRVLVIFTQFMVSVGVSSLLRREDGLSLTGTVFINKQILLKDLKRILPDVIILDDTLLWEDASLMVDLLGEYNKLRVIVVQTQENRMQVYDQQDLVIQQSADLCSAVRKPACSPVAQSQ